MTLKPQDFAVKITCIPVDAKEYKFGSQSRFNGENDLLTISKTYNATQTFDHKGNPTDSDDDND